MIYIMTLYPVDLRFSLVFINRIYKGLEFPNYLIYNFQSTIIFHIRNVAVALVSAAHSATLDMKIYQTPICGEPEE